MYRQNSDGWDYRNDDWKSIGGQRGGICGRGWVGVKGACKRAKKGDNALNKELIKESKRALADKIRAKKGMKSVSASNQSRMRANLKGEAKAPVQKASTKTIKQQAAANNTAEKLAVVAGTGFGLAARAINNAKNKKKKR